MINNIFDRTANENKTLGVEFVDGKLRVIQFQRRGKGYVLRSFVQKDLPEGSYEGSQITNPAIVGEILSAAINEAKPRSPDTNYVICLIPQKDIFLITQDIPKVNKDEAQSVIANKIGDLIPMPVSEVYWDWRIITEYENKMQVQIAASSKILIDSYMKCFDEAKVVPLIFEPSAEAASRVGLDKDSNENLLLLELNDKSAIVSIIRNQSVIFSTDVPLEVSPSGDINVNQLTNRIQEIINYIQQQSRQQFKFNTNAHIYGKAAMVEKILKSLDAVQSPYNFSRISYQKSNENKINEFIPVMDEYVPLVGAGIRGLPNYTETASSINLVPEEAKKSFSKKQTQSIITRYTFFFMLDAILILVSMLVLNARAQSELAEYKQILQQATAISQADAIKNLETGINNVNKQSLTINTINNQLYAWDRVVIALSDITPVDVRFEQVRLAPNSDKQGRYEFNISGRFEDRLSVIELANQMRELPYFTGVALPVGSLEESNEGAFVIEGLLNMEELLLTKEPTTDAKQQEVLP